MDSINVSELVERLGSDEDAVRKMAVFKLQSTYFGIHISSLTHILNLETCLVSTCSLDGFQGSLYPLGQARLTPKS